MDKVGAINQRMDGSTSREAAAAKIIITAVSIPNVANKGIGANAIIAVSYTHLTLPTNREV